MKCEHCGDEFERTRTNGRPQKYCSASCRQKASYVLHRDKRRAKMREAYRENAEARKSASREWAKANRDRLREVKREWRKTDTGKACTRRTNARQGAQRRGAAVRESDPTFIKHDSCQVCGSTHNLEVEHLTPIAAGGTHYIENLTTMCADCNRGPGGKHVLGPHVWSEFVRWFLDRRDNPHEKVQKIVTL